MSKEVLYLREELFEYECGEPQCCTEFYDELYINDKLVLRDMSGNITEIGEVLEHLGYEVKYEN